MTSQEPIVVMFRLDAACPQDAQVVIDAIRRVGDQAGIVILPHHTHRPKRGEGVFWDGQIVATSPAPSEAPARTTATRTDASRELPPTRTTSRRVSRPPRSGG